jgi:deferrochelatase/peroxidase EfeB
MRVSRRGFLGLAAGAGAAGLVAGASSGSEPAAETVPFHGARQAGIVTPAQDRLHMAAFDVAPGTSRGDLRDLLRAWTAAAPRLTAGRPVGETGDPLAPPVDTGEAAGLPPARLTLTLGLGPALFDDRFGLAGQRPAALRELEALPGDALEPARSGGDLCVQACADDPQVVFHAARNLARIGRGVVAMRWSQLGFGRTSRTTAAQATPRNLMGFKDGTNNLTAEDTAGLARSVWVGAEAPAWLRGGTYLVARRIRMLIEVWDRAALADQEQTIGRAKASGAPLGSRHEHDPVRPAALPADSHVRLAHGDVKLLRRGYSFTDGFDAERGQLDAGLFFIAFQRDPAQFVELQRRLGASDKLNEYIEHTSSALFAIPPGVRPGGFLGDRLLSA